MGMFMGEEEIYIYVCVCVCVWRGESSELNTAIQVDDRLH
jgi:hypothetical protein